MIFSQEFLIPIGKDSSLDIIFNGDYKIVFKFQCVKDARKGEYKIVERLSGEDDYDKGKKSTFLIRYRNEGDDLDFGFLKEGKSVFIRTTTTAGQQYREQVKYYFLMENKFNVAALFKLFLTSEMLNDE